MSRAEEKKTPLELLKHKLHLLGLADQIAAKNMLNELQPKQIPGSLVDSVNHLLTLAVDKQKQQFKGTLLDLSEKALSHARELDTDIHREIV